MREIALHLLDIAENSVAAKATMVEITVLVNLGTDRLYLSVEDNGKGMDAETLARVIDPFVTSRTTRKVGLGIPLFRAAAQACNGDLYLSSTPQVGTKLEVEFQYSHIDRMPVGDLPGTILALVIGHPENRWRFTYSVSDLEGKLAEQFDFDDADIKAVLGDVPMSDPLVMGYLRNLLEDGCAEVGAFISQNEAALFRNTQLKI